MESKETFPFPQEWKRKSVLFAIRAGHDNATIAKFFDLTTTWVWKIRNQLEESGGDYEAVAKRSTHQTRSDCLRTAKFVDKVKNVISKDPGKSMRAIAKDMKTSEALIRKCVSEDLRYKSYKMRKGQLLTAKAKEKRLKHSKKLLNKLKHPLQTNMIWFFSDEKNFCQDQAVNSQNNRWLAVCPKDVPKVMQTKFPATVMVFGVVSSEGHVMPPYIFPKGLKVNTEEYLKVLEMHVLPWIRKVAAGRPYVWQQDSAPCHTSRKAQAWLSDKFYDFVPPDVWPPNSPDLNPMDFFVWGAIERCTNKSPCNTKEELIKRIKSEFKSMKKAQVVRACSRFRGRIEAVIEANSDFIE